MFDGLSAMAGFLRNAAVAILAMPQAGVLLSWCHHSHVCCAKKHTLNRIPAVMILWSAIIHVSKHPKGVEDAPQFHVGQSASFCETLHRVAQALAQKLLHLATQSGAKIFSDVFHETCCWLVN